MKTVIINSIIVIIFLSCAICLAEEEQKPEYVLPVQALAPDSPPAAWSEEKVTTEHETLMGAEIITDMGGKHFSGTYWIFIVVTLTFLSMILIPFIPGIIETFRPKDDYPLPVKMDYSKDPRFFGKSFRAKLNQPASQVLANNSLSTESNMQFVTISREEKAEFITDKEININSTVHHVLYVQNSLKTNSNVRFLKEIYIRGNAYIGENNTIRALAADGKIVLGTLSNIMRWVDAIGSIEVGEGCNLGVSVSTESYLKIGKHCVFKRLYGLPIMTYNTIETKLVAGFPNPPEVLTNPVSTIEDTTILLAKDYKITSDQEVEKDIIAKDNLIIEDEAIIEGTLRVYGNVVLGKNVVCFGNVFAEGNIDIQENTVVIGNLFSQSIITLANGVRIGTKEASKSVIGKKQIILSENVVIFGYVLTEGSGVIR